VRKISTSGMTSPKADRRFLLDGRPFHRQVITEILKRNGRRTAWTRIYDKNYKGELPKDESEVYFRKTVMPALSRASHVLAAQASKTWMAGKRPAMTRKDAS